MTAARSATISPRLRYLAATIALCSGVFLSPGWAGAAPKPPPQFWSAGRCERVLLGVYGYSPRLAPPSVRHQLSGASGGFPLPTGDGNSFHVGQAICIGSGGPLACRWTTAHRARLYSEFSVFTRSPLNGGAVRAWTLATRAGHGFAPIAHHAGDQYAGWPPDFFMSRVGLLAAHATAARFRTIVAPITARLIQQETTTSCSGG